MMEIKFVARIGKQKKIIKLQYTYIRVYETAYTDQVIYVCTYIAYMPL